MRCRDLQMKSDVEARPHTQPTQRRDAGERAADLRGEGQVSVDVPAGIRSSARTPQFPMGDRISEPLP